MSACEDLPAIPNILEIHNVRGTNGGSARILLLTVGHLFKSYLKAIGLLDADATFTPKNTFPTLDYTLNDLK